MFAPPMRDMKPAGARLSSATRARVGVLQRTCSCGGSAGPGECAECRRRHEREAAAPQMKLRISQPGDQYEQEADRVAAAVSGSLHQDLPRRTISRRAEDRADSLAETGVVEDVLRSPGRALEAPVRSLMESRLGHDFSQVRVHTDARADESVQAVQARAYTVGRDVVFGAGQYRPQSAAGQRLLAHELVHVIQQGGVQQGGAGARTGTAAIRERVSTNAAAMLMRGVPGDEWADWCSPCLFGTKMCHAEADIAPLRCKHVVGSWYRCPC